MMARNLGGLLALLALAVGSPASVQAQFGATKTVPSPAHFQAIGGLNAGQINDAGELFQRAYRSAIKSPTTHWIDSIAYHTMMGECHYQMGNLAEALEQYNAALELYNRFPNWMLDVSWPPAGIRQENLGKIRQVPWGPRRRATPIGAFPETVSIQQGRIDNNAVVQQGGLIQQAVQYPIIPQEIVRCTALALRRRMELLGPAGPLDRLNRDTMNQLIGPVAPQGHWTESWRQLLLGLSYMTAGNTAQAQAALQRSLLADGQFDHPLTAVGLFELGRLEMQAGQFDKALEFFHEASCLAYQFDDYGLIEECMRSGALAHMLANKPGVYAPLVRCLDWAGRNTREVRALAVSVGTQLAESQINVGDLNSAAANLENAQRNMARSDLAMGRVGAALSFVSATFNYRKGDVRAGDADFAAALAYQQGRSPKHTNARLARRNGPASLWLFHIQLADSKFRSGDLSSPRDALLLYQMVLREPTAADWRSSPLESMTVLMTPHAASIENWFETAMTRKEYPAALEISDLARRHRFFNTLTRGGRLVALRWVLEAPDVALSQDARLQRQALLAAFPAYQQLATQAKQLRDQLKALPSLPTDRDQVAGQEKLFEQLAAVHLNQELILRQMSVARLPCEMSFPPRRRVEEIQASLGPNKAMLAFYQTQQRMYGFYVNGSDLVVWDVGPPQAVSDRARGMLREMGHIEGNRALALNQLERDEWKKPATELMAAMTPPGRTLLPVEELIIVPDGAMWYVPFEALPAPRIENSPPLITQTRIRLAPTTGLAVPDGRRPNPLPKTLVTAGQLYTKEPDGQTARAATRLADELPGATSSAVQQISGPTWLFTTLFDRIVTLHDLSTREAPYAFNPIAPVTSRGSSDSLNQWMTLPLAAPDQVILPGFHTAAEDAMDRSSAADGNEMFLNVMAMMASGTRTMLVSRWRIGGQSALDFVTEFTRELDHTSPADAYQRAVFLAMEAELQGANEGRIQSGNGGEMIPGGHPFFWSSFALIDSGTPATPSADAPAGQNPAVDLEAEQRRQLLEQLKRQQEGAAEAP
jgi:tetratricopeptide (TPR) repeat protein